MVCANRITHAGGTNEDLEDPLGDDGAPPLQTSSMLPLQIHEDYKPVPLNEEVTHNVPIFDTMRPPQP